MVPEAYRQRFCSWKREDKQSHVEVQYMLDNNVAEPCSSIWANFCEVDNIRKPDVVGHIWE